MTPQTEAFIKDRLLAGYTSAEIAKEYPRLGKNSINTYASGVRKILTSHEKLNATKAKNSRRYTRAVVAATPASISNTHWKIGLRIKRLRIEESMTVGEFSSGFNFSTRNKISKMENGQHDFTISELVDLSKILNISLEKLVLGSF